MLSSHIVVPYAEFLERRERRNRLACELRRREAQRAIDALDVVVMADTLSLGEQEHRREAHQQPAPLRATDSFPRER